MYVAPSYEDCPVCGSRMSCGYIDSRGEWCRCNYYCDQCDHTFPKLVTFKIQSEEVESEVWEDLPASDPYFEKEQIVHFMWNGKKEQGRIWKRHVKEGKFHYHIDCLSVTSHAQTRPGTELEFAESELF